MIADELINDDAERRILELQRERDAYAQVIDRQRKADAWLWGELERRFGKEETNQLRQLYADVSGEKGP